MYEIFNEWQVSNKHLISIRQDLKSGKVCVLMDRGGYWQLE